MQNIKIKHISSLFQMLHKYREAFIKTPPEKMPQRLYFVDVDIMTDYIHGSVQREKLSWANLLNLESEGHVTPSLSPEEIELTSAISQTISRFLFGQFNTQLHAQQKRYYLTPDYERELRGVVYRVLNEFKNIPSNDLLNKLKGKYLELCHSSLPAQEAWSVAKSIVDILDQASFSGQIPRAHALLQDYTSPLSNNLVRPIIENGSSFIFSQDNPYYQKQFDTLKGQFFDVFLENLGKRHPGAEKYFSIKRKIHSMHSATLPLKRYVDAVQNDEYLLSLGIPLDELEKQAVIAAREANDVTSLARLAALADYLNLKHQMENSRAWKSCLITGSSMLRHLHEALLISPTVDTVYNVEIVHPLCFLARPELSDPQGVKCTPDVASCKMPDQESAFSWELGRTETDSPMEPTIDPEDFIRGLTHNLHTVIAREAKDNDRSLGSFWHAMEFEEGYNQEDLRINVRSLIGQSFFKAFTKLAVLLPRPGNHLDPINIPVLRDFQSPNSNSTATLELIQSYKNTPEINKSFRGTKRYISLIESSNFNEVLSDDRTCYQAMLCVAIGFIAQGKEWLRAAETMAHTAVMIAAGNQEADSYPQGNEARYLSAFLSRIMFDPRQHPTGETDCNISENISLWHQQQEATLAAAHKALEEWRKADAKLADEKVPILTYTRYGLVKFRYEVEAAVAKTYALLWSVLLIDSIDPTQTNACHPDTAPSIFKDLCAQLNFAYQLENILHQIEDQENTLLVANHYRQTATYIASQLWGAILQCWLCLRFKKSDGKIIFVGSIPDPSVEEHVAFNENIIKDKLYDYHNNHHTDIGRITKLVMETFAIAKLGVRKGDWGLTSESFKKEDKFAAIDELRFQFFEDCWNLSDQH